MSALSTVSVGADSIGKANALQVNIAAGKGLQNVLKSNLGPKGTMKMLVGGAGQIKLTKDGKVLLDEMQIQHPTAAIIARTATAQDDITGDGTTSNVLFTGELLKQSERYIAEGLHPRVLVEGLELAKDDTLKYLELFKTEMKTNEASASASTTTAATTATTKKPEIDRALLVQVARTSLRTKLYEELADHLCEIIVDAVLTIRKDDQPIDLHMIEIMHMKHQTALDSKFIDGLVLDHGARHPDMPKRSENCYIFVCNCSLEYEKSMVNAGFFYKDAQDRAKLVNAERKFTDDRVAEIIKFKKSVCTNGEGFILINQKGIDPISLDALNRAGIVAIRRAKRRNMERIPKACGGSAVNHLDSLSVEQLGKAKLVYEHQLGDDKYTFIEGTANATSCTILIRGPNDHTIRQMLDAVHDGLRAVANLLDDQALVAGAGAFELAAYNHLMSQTIRKAEGRVKLGVQCFADAMLVIPKTLLDNSGLDVQACLVDLKEEAARGNRVGVDVVTGKPILPDKLGIWDNYRVKKQFLHLGSLIAIKLLLVDEVMRAGKKMGNKG